MPEGICNSVATKYQVLSRPIRQKRGPGSPRRFFGDFLCVQKVTRVRGGEPRENEGRSSFT